jgi:hypothetical protein
MGLCVCVGGFVFADKVFALQVGDGTSGTNRLTPVDVVGLGSGVANVALGDVRLFCEACRCVLVFFSGYWVGGCQG